MATSERPNTHTHTHTVMPQMASKAFRSVKEQPGSDRWNEANGNQKKTWNTHDALKKDTDRGGQRGTQESHTCTGPNDEPNSARNAKKINAKPSEMKTDGSLLLLSFSCFSFFFNLEGPSAFRRCASFPFASVYPSIHLGSMIGLMDYLGSACGGSLLQTESQLRVRGRSENVHFLSLSCVVFAALFYLSGSADGKSLNLRETRRRLQALSLSLFQVSGSQSQRSSSLKHTHGLHRFECWLTFSTCAQRWDSERGEHGIMELLWERDEQKTS